MRSGRSWYGTALRVYLGISMVAIAFLVPRGSVAFWGWIVAGVAAFVAFPLVIQMLLKPIAKKVDAANRKQATDLLSGLRERKLVRLFAPNGWTTLQEAKLHLCLGEGRAAAKAFADTAKLSRVAGNKPSLISAQAHCLLLAGDRREARELLSGLRKSDELSANDRLNLGIASLFDAAHGNETRELLAEAHESLGDHPRMLAALSIASERNGDEDRALEYLEQAEREQSEREEDDHHDPLASELIKRARKGLREQLRAQNKKRGKEKRGKGKRGKRAGAQGSEPEAGAGGKTAGAMAEGQGDESSSLDQGRSSSKGKQSAGGRKSKAANREAPKGSKKARKQARREARRQAKADERARRQSEREAADRKKEQERRRRLEAAVAGKGRAKESPTPRKPSSTGAPKPVPAAIPRSAPLPRPLVPPLPAAPKRPPAAQPPGAGASTQSATARASAKPKAPPKPSIFAAPLASAKPSKPAASAKSAGKPPAPSPFAPPSLRPLAGKKEAAAGAPGTVKPLVPPPPILPPPPVAAKPKTAKPPAEDDGWGDALGAPAPPAPLSPKKPRE
jgi:hypothetical protein